MVGTVTCDSTDRIGGALAALGDQFPQAADPAEPVLGPARSGPTVFGLRFAEHCDGSFGDELPPSRICPDRQIAVDPNTGVPWWTLFAAGTGSMQTTGASTDGQGSTGNEEWKPDFAGDMT